MSDKQLNLPSLLHEFSPTEIAYMTAFSEKYGVDVYVKRDDLFSQYLGGNKARKMQYILHKAELEGANAIVTAGGVQSNHARVTAIAASQKGWKVTLVLHEDDEDRFVSEGNLLIMQLCGARIKKVNKLEVSQVMNEEMKRFKDYGFSPFYVYGGGHSVEGTFAYYEAVHELSKQIKNLTWVPDYIFLPSGTGTTQAGIHAGAAECFPNAKVIGISVAREHTRGKDAIVNSIDKFSKVMKTKYTKDIDFRDQWTFGGYEKYNQRLKSVIQEIAKLDGLLLDPTYTGKAFLALKDLIKSGEIIKGSTVLFWHTGGLLNLLSSRHFLSKSLI